MIVFLLYLVSCSGCSLVPARMTEVMLSFSLAEDLSYAKANPELTCTHRFWPTVYLIR